MFHLSRLRRRAIKAESVDDPTQTEALNHDREHGDGIGGGEDRGPVGGISDRQRECNGNAAAHAGPGHNGLLLKMGAHAQSKDWDCDRAQASEENNGNRRQCQGYDARGKLQH